MPMQANDIERLIKARIPDAEVTIRDLAGDGDHYSATVLSESFRGKSRVQQHQIVYDALKAEMGGKLHALALQTGVPAGLMPAHNRRSCPCVSGVKRTILMQWRIPRMPGTPVERANPGHNRTKGQPWASSNSSTMK